MNPRHAAALALVSWYLTLPPMALSQTVATSETRTFDFSQTDLAKLAKMGPYDPARAVLPNPKLTPGDVLPAASADDVCTPGWATEHRHVTESMRDQVYAEYGKNPQEVGYCGAAGCEVDHLIALELGGSNDIKNLWPQPTGPPLPGAFDKDGLENELHHLVCKGKISLTDAQKCIASNWVKCWGEYVVPLFSPPVSAVPLDPVPK